MSATPGVRYRRLRVRLAALHEGVEELEALEEIVAAWLWERGTAGIEQPSSEGGEAVLLASFEAASFPSPEELEALTALAPGAEVADLGWVEERDWLATWREQAQPIELGEHLVVDPREWETGTPPATDAAERVEGGGERFRLAIPARTAFGVGSHESTRLAYELLEATPLAGRRVLDVGCGSGILAMAALLLGARAAVGFDIDPTAGLLAGQYARHNRLQPAIYTGTVAALATPRTELERFEVVVLNVLPHEIADELGAVVEQLAEEGELLVSGVLASEAASVAAALAQLGCRPAGRIAAGEWVGLRFRRDAHAAAGSGQG